MVLVAAVALASLLIGMAFVRRSAGDRSSRIARLLLPLALVLTVFVAWAAFRLLPHWTWSAARLASAARIALGFPLYSAPDSAVVNGWIYGPMSALLLLPATLAREPLDALHIAAVLNAVYFLLPLFALLAGLLRRPETHLTGAWLVVFGVGVLLIPFATWYGAAALGSDTVTVCLGACSCLVLAHGGRPAVAALLCVLAIWTKQIAALVPLAQLLWLLAFDGRQSALRYLGWLCGAMVLLTVAFVAAFGPETLWHCLVRIPATHAVNWPQVPALAVAILRATWWVLPVAFLAWKTARGSPGHAFHWRCGVLLLGVGASVLPTGLMAAAKIGGDQNSLHFIPYALLAGIAFAAQAIVHSPRERAGKACVALLLAAGVALGINLVRLTTHDHLAVATPGDLQVEAATFVREHPGQVWLPGNPLVTLLLERRDLPLDYGLYDWRLAGAAPEPAKLRAVMPSTLTFIVYHERDPSREALRYFPEFNRVYRTGEWHVFTRSQLPAR